MSDGAPGEGHPGPLAVAMPRAIADAIVAQARVEYPMEACGVVIGTADPTAGGEAVRYEACRNAAASPVRYVIDPGDVLRLSDAADEADEAFWAIVHSHVKSPAVPSPTDVGLAAWWPSCLYVLVSLAADHAGPDGEPSLRAWRIVDGAVHEVGLEIA